MLGCCTNDGIMYLAPLNSGRIARSPSRANKKSQGKATMPQYAPTSVRSQTKKQKIGMGRIAARQLATLEDAGRYITKLRGSAVLIVQSERR